MITTGGQSHLFRVAVRMYRLGREGHNRKNDSSSDSRVNVRIAFLGFENQSKYEKDMPLRVIGYDGAAYRSELSQEDRYPGEIVDSYIIRCR